MNSHSEVAGLERLLGHAVGGLDDDTAIGIVEMLGELDGRALAGAFVYLGVTDAASRTELMRALAPYLEVTPEAVAASIDRLVADGKLQQSGDAVSGDRVVKLVDDCTRGAAL
jgi:hypothetical protein